MSRNKAKQTGATEAAPVDVLIQEWRKNSTQVVRVTLQMFRGIEMISIRVWYRGPDGAMLPGKNGVSLPADKYIKKLQKALKSAGDATAQTSAPDHKGEDNG